MLLVAAPSARANVFGVTDPRRFVDRDETPIVEVVSDFRPVQPDSEDVVEVLASGGRPIGTGSGVLVSPCYMLTAHHVVFNDDSDVAHRAGVGFKVTVRIGSARTPLGGSVVRYGQRTRDGQGDWALVRLDHDADGRCPGERLGWIDESHVALPRLLQSGVMVSFLGLARDVTDPTVTAVHDGCHVFAQDDAYGTFSSNCAVRRKSSGGAITLAEGPCRAPRLVGLVIKDLTPEPGLLPYFDLRHAAVAVSVAQAFAVAEVARDVAWDRLGKHNSYAARFACDSRS